MVQRHQAIGSASATLRDSSPAKVGSGARRATIADVARVAGVSKAAVSFAFNMPERLNSDTATRIRAIASELDYRPHPVARMLSTGRTRTIGILTPQALSLMFENPFFAAFNAGAARAAEASGYALQFVSPLHGSLAGAMNRATVDGVVAIGLSQRHPEVEEIRRAGVPMVMVDSKAMPSQLSVEVDDEGGARLAAEHLAQLGHRDILVVAVESPDHWDVNDPEGVTARRLRGYRAALGEAGVDLPEAAVVNAQSTIPGGSDAFLLARGAGRRPTAVLAMSDAIAVGVMRAAREIGLSVPGDLSVVGFDDVDLARYADPALTTVHQPIGSKGARAVELLLASLAGEPAGDDDTPLKTHLVVRASTARVAEAK